MPRGVRERPWGAGNGVRLPTANAIFTSALWALKAHGAVICWRHGHVVHARGAEGARCTAPVCAHVGPRHRHRIAMVPEQAGAAGCLAVVGIPTQPARHWIGCAGRALEPTRTNWAFSWVDTAGALGRLCAHSAGV